MAQFEPTVEAIPEELWQGLSFTYDPVFCTVMKDPGICKRVIEAVLGIQVAEVQRVEDQHFVRGLDGGKTRIFDVHVVGCDGRHYDIEMQQVDSGELPQRARSYIAGISTEQLRKGQSYRDLAEAYVIFLCGEDVFGRGLPLYSFSFCCEHDKSLGLGDGAHVVFACYDQAERAADPALRELLTYLGTRETSGKLSNDIERSVRQVVLDSDWRARNVDGVYRDKYFQKIGLEQGIQEGRREGLELGREEGLREGREEGRQEGREEGLQEGRGLGHQEVLQLLETQGLDPEVLARMRACLNASLTKEPGDAATCDPAAPAAQSNTPT